MGGGTAWPNWIDRPILIRLYDLVNDVPVSPEDYKQTLIDAANEISDLADDATDLVDDDDEDEGCEGCGCYTGWNPLCGACLAKLWDGDEQAADAVKGE